MEEIEKTKEFVVEPPKSPREYERAELQSDISVFSEDARPLVEKHLRGEKLQEEEGERFSDARNRWWYTKYGFSYRNKVIRTEVLRRKYVSSEVVEANLLQEELFYALEEQDQEKIAELKKVYEEKYPEQLEGVVALFELTPFLETSKELEKRSGKTHEERMEMFENETRYLFLLTHFIASNSHNKEFLNVFWRTARGVARRAGEKTAKKEKNLKRLRGLRRGVLSQVATLKTLEALGAKPKLSNPKEDAFYAIDLWTDEKSAVQIKSGGKELLITETDKVGFPGVEIEKGDEIHHFDSRYFSRELRKFRAKLSRYQSIIKKKIKGYLIFVPYTQFDPVTGQPNKELIDSMRKKLTL